MSLALRVSIGLIVLVIAVFAFGLVPKRVGGTLRGLEDQRERAAKDGVGAAPMAQQWAEFREFEKETARQRAQAESLAIARRASK